MKADCSQSEIYGFDISQSFELKCSKKVGLEGVLILRLKINF